MSRKHEAFSKAALTLRAYTRVWARVYARVECGLRMHCLDAETP